MKEHRKRPRELRLAGRLDEAIAWIQHADAPEHIRRQLLWENQALWWREITGGDTTLRKRGPVHSGAIRQAWSNIEFLTGFNRSAPPLPTDPTELRKMLWDEHCATVLETKALHWMIESKGRPVAMVSVVDISLQHRRAEFLIGSFESCGARTIARAAFLAIEFVARNLALARLTAYFYPSNQPAIRAAESLGFRVEGVLRSYIQPLDGGTRSDLVVAGLLLDTDFFNRTAGLRDRLLRRAK